MRWVVPCSSVKRASHLDAIHVGLITLNPLINLPHTLDETEFHYGARKGPLQVGRHSSAGPAPA